MEVREGRQEEMRDRVKSETVRGGGGCMDGRRRGLILPGLWYKLVARSKREEVPTVLPPFLHHFIPDCFHFSCSLIFGPHQDVGLKKIFLWEKRTEK